MSVFLESGTNSDLIDVLPRPTSWNHRTQCLCGLPPPLSHPAQRFDLHNGLPSKEITQTIGFQGASRQSMRRVPLMWSELNGGLNSHVFYNTTPTNWGHSDAPDRPAEADNGSTMADTGHRPTLHQKGEHQFGLWRVYPTNSPPKHPLGFKIFTVRLTSALALVKNTCCRAEVIRRHVELFFEL